MLTPLDITVDELLPGDEFHADGIRHYEVVDVDTDRAGVVRAEVRFADGGTGWREWDGGTEITIRREVV